MNVCVPTGGHLHTHTHRYTMSDEDWDDALVEDEDPPSSGDAPRRSVKRKRGAKRLAEEEEDAEEESDSSFDAMKDDKENGDATVDTEEDTDDEEEETDGEDEEDDKGIFTTSVLSPSVLGETCDSVHLHGGLRRVIGGVHTGHPWTLADLNKYTDTVEPWLASYAKHAFFTSRRTVMAACKGFSRLSDFEYEFKLRYAKHLSDDVWPKARAWYIEQRQHCASEEVGQIWTDPKSVSVVKRTMTILEYVIATTDTEMLSGPQLEAISAVISGIFDSVERKWNRSEEEE
jgi:hypothetical protein